MYAQKGRRGAKVMTSFYCLRAYKDEGLSENHRIWAGYFMDGPFQRLYMGMSLCSLLKLKFGIYDISYTIFYTKFNIFYINSIQ